MARVGVACVVASGVLTWAGCLRAQILSKAEASDNKSIDVRLEVVHAKGVRLELYDPTERPPRHLPAAVCFDRCAVNAVPGRYLLRVSGPWGSDVKASKRFLDLEESSDVFIEPPSTFGRYFGLTLGILGPTLIASGLVMMLASNQTEERAEPWYSMGGAMALTGVVATPIGWIMFGANGKPYVEMRRR